MAHCLNVFSYLYKFKKKVLIPSNKVVFLNIFMSVSVGTSLII